MLRYVSLVLTVFLLSCNAALDDFNAPVGATISFAPQGDTWQACVGSTGYTKVAARIETPNSATGQSETSQGIFGQLFAQGPLQLYVKAESAEILEPIESQLARIDSDSLTFTTNRRGLYEFVVGAPGTLPGEQYEDCVTLFLGVTTADFCVSVDCPAETP